MNRYLEPPVMLTPVNAWREMLPVEVLFSFTWS